MNQSHGRNIQPAHAWTVSIPIVFICTMCARLLVLQAIESPRSKGVRAGTQDAQGFAKEGFF